MSHAGPVTLYRWGGVDPVPVVYDRVACSWPLSALGTLTMLIQPNEARRLDLASRGYWIGYEHPTAGHWGGIVGNIKYKPGGVEVPAVSFGTFLERFIVPRTYDRRNIPPGAHLRRMIVAMEREFGPIGFTALEIDEDGTSIDVEARLETILHDILPDMVEDGHEWRTTGASIHERVFEFRAKIGDDHTGREALLAGRHVVEYDVEQLRTNIRNDVVAAGGPAVNWKGVEVRVSAETSMGTWGRWMLPLVYERFLTRQAKRVVRPRARKVLRRHRHPERVARLVVQNEDDCFAWLHEGDTVRVVIPEHALDLDMRIGARSIDGERMTLGVVEVER